MDTPNGKVPYNAYVGVHYTTLSRKLEVKIPHLNKYLSEVSSMTGLTAMPYGFMLLLLQLLQLRPGTLDGSSKRV